jgi:hypothetical protein
LLTCRRTCSLRTENTSRLNSMGIVPSGHGKNMPARRLRRVTRMGSFERSNPVA